MQDEEGRWRDKEADIEEVFVDYFSNIFKSSNPSNMEDIFNAMDRKVSNEMNAFLDKDFSEEKLHKALFQMCPNKASGPDGMSACFYQKHWSIVGKDICKVVGRFLNGEGQLSKINQTNVVLIPKNKTPASARDYRPISLCNVVYKIIAKALVNRLKTILPRIIDESQSAFVPGRVIFDNIIVAHEVIHNMNTKKKGKTGYVAVKLDE